MSNTLVTKAIMLDETGQAIVEAINKLSKSVSGQKTKVVDKLYEAATGAGAPLTTDITYLSGRLLSDYDLISVCLSDPTTFTQGTLTQVDAFNPASLIVDDAPVNAPVGFTTANDGVCYVHFKEDCFYVVSQSGSTDEEPSVYSIYGIKVGGSDVSITPSLGSGTKVADYEIDGVAGEIYAPTAPTALSQLSDDSTHRVVTDTEKTSWNSKADESDIPTTLAELGDDSTHRLVTDAEKTAWDAKSTVEANPLGEATGELKKVGINNAIYEIVGGEKVYGEASGAISSFADGTDNPLKELKVSIVPVQSGSGDPSPSNPRAISGWTGANIYNAGGVNLAENITLQNGAINAYDGSIVSSNTRLYSDEIVVEAGTYRINTTPILSNVVRVWKMNGTFDSSKGDGGVWQPNGRTITFDEACKIRIMFSYNNGEQTNISPSDVEEVIVNRVLVVPISWQTEAGEVFGGKMNLTSGVLTVDRVKQTYNGTENITASAYHFLNVPVSMGHKLGADNGGITSHFLFISSGSNGFTIGNNNNFYWFWPNTDSEWYDNAEAFKTFLATQYANNTPLEICYPLATPITIQLTPTQVSSILGSNNIWADCGDSDVVYIRDLNICINDLISRIEALEQ